MHLKPAKTAATAATIGGALVLGLGSAQAAMAKPTSIYHVPCSAGALAWALSHVSSGGTLFLTAGCTYYLPDGLTDNVDDLTIVGYDSTLRGGGPDSDFSILTVNCMKTLTLDGVNFTEGSQEDGGAIDNSGHLTINGGVFSNNTGEYGGAIDSGGYSSSLTIDNAVFTRNSASDEGGAIDVGKDLTVTHTQFGQNTGYYGGAIYDDADDATVAQSTFLGNGGDQGGAIYIEDDLTLTNVTGVAGSGNTLSGNRADQGGGIYNDGDTNLDYSVIVSNEAHAGGGVYNSDCGDIISTTGTTVYRNVTNNWYQESGGC